MAVKADELPADTIAAEGLPPDVAMLTGNTDEGMQGAYGDLVDPMPATSDDPATPTMDQLLESAQQGLDAPPAPGMMVGAQRLLGAEDTGGGNESRLQFRGFEGAQYIRGYRTTTGGATRLSLHYAPGRQRHDYGAYYWRKRHPHGDVTIPHILWGKPVFTPRPPASPPQPITRIAENCDFCEKDGFPSEAERRIHMQKKHGREYGDREQDEARQEEREDRAVIRSILKSNTMLMETVLRAAGITDEQRESLASSLAEVDQAAEAAPPPTVRETKHEESPHTQWVSMIDATKFYKLTKASILKRIRAEPSEISAYKDEHNRWRVLVPSGTWVPTGK
jgi:hypothetical protein